MIAVVDYKAGNLTSVLKALRAVGAECTVTADPAVVRCAEKIVLPGVGHFAATSLLEECGLKAAIRERIDAGVPFLGICVGLQWLFAGSTEAPATPGLGVFAELCERFDSQAKCPHVGWNALTLTRESALTAGVGDGAFVYYTHSYRAPVVADTCAVTDYGGAFTAVVTRANVYGVQFHPEKSAEAGLRMLRNFTDLRAC